MSNDGSEPRISRLQNVVLLVVVLGGLAVPTFVGWQAQLWFDETYTGVIASQSGFAEFINWCMHELSGPAYYSVSWIWSKITGLSNFALRFPSYLCLLAAIATILWFGPGDRKFRLVWAGLIATWIPGSLFATQARPQALLVLFATIQTILFIKAYATKDRKHYLLWSVATTLLLLTHLYSAIIGGLQFLVLAWRIRQDWRRYWATALPFTIAASWLAFQLPFLLQFAQPGNSWQPVLTFDGLARVATDLFGYLEILPFLVLMLCLASIGLVLQRQPKGGAPGKVAPESIVFSTALVAILAVVGLGMFGSYYVGRYLVPFVPALFIGMAYIITRLRLFGGWFSALVLMPLLFYSLTFARDYHPADDQKTLYPLEFERGSAWLANQQSNRVIFAWDNQAAAINSDERLAEVGGFFFRRDDVPARILVARWKDGADWGLVLDQMSKKENADVLWLGGEGHPAALLTNPAYKCRRWGDENARQSMACKRIEPTHH